MSERGPGSPGPLALVLRADARALPLPDESVDLIVTSPPYFGLRSYRDGDEHYDGQLGSEPTPAAFLEALWTVTAECWRVLKPSGSMFVNLGDKRSGSGAPGTTSGLMSAAGSTPRAIGSKAHRPVEDTYVQGVRAGKRTYGHDRREEFGRPKSKMLLPHRYAIGCEDGAADPEGIGWIVRQDMVWSKPNGLPESVRDRVRDSHEYWFMLNREGDYYAAMDEVREPYSPASLAIYEERGASVATGHDQTPSGSRHRGDGAVDEWRGNPLGKIPNSVWTVPTEPLRIPRWAPAVEHFAAFPTEWPRRLILGWSPSGICLECGTGRRPVVDTEYRELHRQDNHRKLMDSSEPDGNTRGINAEVRSVGENVSTIVGYACACTPYTDHPGTGKPSPTAGPDGRQGDRPVDIGATHERVGPTREYHFDRWTPAPTRPAVILDPFGGTGTTAMVARALGRIGISVDLSLDYCRLARWRIFESGGGAKAIARTDAERQGTLL